MLMPCIFSRTDDKVVIERKVLALKRKLKNPNDRRVQENRTTVIYYVPISRDLANRLHLTENSFVKCEIAKSGKLQGERGEEKKEGEASYE
jgi:hypothetical protein